MSRSPVPSRSPASGKAGFGWVPAVGYLVGLLTVLPMLWLTLAAFRPGSDVFSMSWPATLTLDNFAYVLTEVPFLRYLANSALVSIAVTVIALLLHTMAGYALARLRFRGRGIAFGLVIATLLVSLPVILVPLFMVTLTLGMVDSYAGLIVPSVFNAFGIFLLRQFYLNLPSELEDAALLDGCGYLRLYWHVVLPLSRPVLAALAVLFFLANWNSFVWPLTVTQSENLRVVQVGIASLQGQYAQEYQYVLAASVLAAIPTVIVFMLGQRRLVETLKTSGLR
ncbi:carbohydrate ABC transporter membrane protein 2 (CUT1 family) [Tamaricihabitans halophyticus]|uniref:Carbohydrate ABC transporter membrane protein 2 (CUT1 family) n=1 Tax=Tamaricihabitans halophyticus TaxID=1262583 RepID=A0A4V6NR42_9PSEU|nr:carbohydrate ABC transporter permease [Tamaricihabitans halophyticus]TCP44766.1 carbohydrate ABC transporter membrane protein 2 (CUT1 family) [Tamaricihabitans halophyticus]